MKSETVKHENRGGEGGKNIVISQVLNGGSCNNRNGASLVNLDAGESCKSLLKKHFVESSRRCTKELINSSILNNEKSAVFPKETTEGPGQSQLGSFFDKPALGANASLFDQNSKNFQTENPPRASASGIDRRSFSKDKIAKQFLSGNCHKRKLSLNQNDSRVQKSLNDRKGPLKLNLSKVNINSANNNVAVPQKPYIGGIKSERQTASEGRGSSEVFKRLPFGQIMDSTKGSTNDGSGSTQGQGMFCDRRGSFGLLGKDKENLNRSEMPEQKSSKRLDGVRAKERLTQELRLKLSQKVRAKFEDGSKLDISRSRSREYFTRKQLKSCINVSKGGRYMTNDESVL